MIVVVIAIIMMLSILMSAFISFSPNISHLMEKDFLRRTYSNTVNHSLKYGQLSIRADTLKSKQKKEIETPLRARGKKGSGATTWYVQDKINSTITLSNNKEMKVNVDREMGNK